VNQYRRGARVERILKKKLESEGYYVVRSAGSKGAVDLVAWNWHHCLAIQVALIGVKTKRDFDRLREVTEIRGTMEKRMYEYDRGEWKVTKV